MQVVDEEIPHLPVAVRRARPASATTVFLARHNEQVERLVRLDQRIDHLHGGRWVDVGVELGQHQQELALQFVRVDDVGTGLVFRPDRIAHPLLVPPDLVHPVVVASRERDGDVIELRVEQQRAHRVLATRRATEDPDAADVIPRILRRVRLVPEDAVGEPGVTDVLPRHVVEPATAVCGAQAIDLHDDESEFGDRLHVVIRREILRHEGAVRAGIDVFNDRVLATRVESRGTHDDAPDITRAVATLGGEHFGGTPAGLREFGRVRALELEEDFPVRRTTELRDRRQIDARPCVDVQLTVG